MQDISLKRKEKCNSRQRIMNTEKEKKKKKREISYVSAILEIEKPSFIQKIVLNGILHRKTPMKYK